MIKSVNIIRAKPLQHLLGFSSLHQPTRLSSNLPWQAPPLHWSHTLFCSKAENNERLTSFLVKYGRVPVLEILYRTTLSRQNLQYFMLHTKLTWWRMDPFLYSNSSDGIWKCFPFWKQVLSDLLLEIEHLSTMLLQCSRKRHKVQDQRCVEGHWKSRSMRVLSMFSSSKWILHKRLEICVSSSTSYPLYSRPR